MARDLDRSDADPHMPRIERRAFLGSTLAGAAVAAVPGSPIALPRAKRDERGSPPSTASGRRKADVVVVGAGLAGLMAARRLEAKGVSVVVLEARNRVGGRTLNHPIGDGKALELGGQWIGPLPTDAGAKRPQRRLFELAKALGVKTYRTYTKGNNLNYTNGRLIPYRGRIPPDPGAHNAGLAIEELDAMASKVPANAPWTAPRALEWDAQTFETWMRTHLIPPGMPPTFTTNNLINLAIEAVLTVEPRDLSLLHVVWYIASAGSLNNLVNTAGGAQDSRFVGGSQLISNRMAKALGDRVILSAPVRRIEQRRGRVDVSTDRLTVSADRVILTIPPALNRTIDYDPPLATFDGGMRDQLIQRAPMGFTIKCMCLYPTPFWREEGLSGQVTSDTGPIKITFDNSPYPDWRPGVLLGFFEGDDAREWGPRSRAERRAAAIECFVRYFGPKAAKPTDYLELNWAAEEYTGGCYGTFFAPGVWTSYGPALRRTLGLIHWAGTETANYWAGYMEGALQSGERVADEVLASLRTRSAR